MSIHQNALVKFKSLVLFAHIVNLGWGYCEFDALTVRNAGFIMLFFLFCISLNASAVFALEQMQENAKKGSFYHSRWIVYSTRKMKS